MNNVEHPDHYTAGPIHDRCGEVVEAITVTQHHNFNVGNAIKYLWRRGLKHHDVLEDLAKARQYIDFEIDRVKYAQARNEDAPTIAEHCVLVDPEDLEVSPPPNPLGATLQAWA